MFDHGSIMFHHVPSCSKHVPSIFPASSRIQASHPIVRAQAAQGGCYGYCWGWKFVVTAVVETCGNPIILMFQHVYPLPLCGCGVYSNSAQTAKWKTGKGKKNNTSLCWSDFSAFNAEQREWGEDFPRSWIENMFIHSICLVYMYIYIYICTCICIFISMYIYIYVYTYIVYTHTYIHTLHYITLHCITLHCITLCYVTLHYIPYHTRPYICI